MSGSNGELSAWESAKPGHADLLDGSPMTEQIASRITRVRRVASDILWLRESDEAWPAEPHPALGGLSRRRSPRRAKQVARPCCASSTPSGDRMPRRADDHRGSGR